jgi:hypothetical protein
VAVLAVPALLLLAQPAAGFRTYCDLDELVRQAQAVIKVRVLSVEKREQGGEIVTLEILKTLRGKCEPKIKLLHRDYHDVAAAPELTVGEECYLCVARYGQQVVGVEAAEKALYVELNGGYGKLALRDGRVILPEKAVPEYLKTRVQGLTEEGFARLVTWIMGPSISVAPIKEAFKWDEPIEFKVTLKNDTTEQMVLMLGKGLGFSLHTQLALRDENGFDAACISGEYYWTGRELAQYQEEEYGGSTVLAPGEAFTATARFQVEPPTGLYAPYSLDPASIRTATVQYKPYNDSATAKNEYGWRGRVMASCSVTVNGSDALWVRDLAKPTKTWLAGLSHAHRDGKEDKAAPQVTLEVWLSRPPPADRDPWDDGPSVSPLPATAEEQKALAACLRVERDGTALPALGQEVSLVREWLLKPPDGRQCPTLCVDLAKWYDVTKPGAYRVRFVLPDKDGDSLSNVVTFAVPEKNQE